MKPYYQDSAVQIFHGNALEVLMELPSESVQTCVTSPPYWGLRDYKVERQIGQEKTPEEYVKRLVGVFRQVKRVLKNEGTMFLNLGDSYFSNGAKYDTFDKAKQDSSIGDSFYENQHDEHKDILLSRNLGISCPVHGQIPEFSEKIQQHKEDQTDHFPIEDSSRVEGHTSCAKQDSKSFLVHEGAPALSFPLSKQSESYLRLRAKNPRLNNSSIFRCEEAEKKGGVFQSSDKKVCICDIVLRLGASDRRKLDIAFSALAYPHSTIKFQKFLKPKDLVGIPWRVAFALQADGWYLRQEIIWAKPNPMPESVTDRPTRAHEQIFLFSKSKKYYYDSEAIKEPAIYFTEDRKDRATEGDKSYPTAEKNGIRKTVYKDARSYDGKHQDKQRGHGRRHAGFNDRWDHMTKVEQCACMRNKRSVWTVATRPFADAHFAVFPPDLIWPCIVAGAAEGETVLDPFSGAGTTCFVAKKRKRKSIGIELNSDYIDIAAKRMSQEVLI